MTAVIATHGSYVSKNEYLKVKRAQMNEFIDIIKNKSVLEFGCGPGGNLFSIKGDIQRGVGIDINPGYIKIANKLKVSNAIRNLDFLTYDGIHFNLPDNFAPNVIFSIGVFERIPKRLVIEYIKSFKGMLQPGDGIIVYFLSERARNSIFTKRLGNQAYVFWSEREITEIFTTLGISIEYCRKWRFADVYVLKV